MTGQDNVTTVKETVRNMLTSLLKVDIYDSFIVFMKEWWSGRFVLTKRDVISKLVELAMSPWTQTVSSTNVNSKTRLLSTGIMNFDMTLVKDTNNDIITSIWEETTEEPELRKVTHKYHIQKNQKQRSKILWFLDRVPLIVKVDSQNEEQVEQSIKLLECLPEKKKLILMGNAGRSEFPNWRVLENLKNLYFLKDIYDKVIRCLRISVQGRSSINLEELIRNIKDFVDVIEIDDLLKMAQQECLRVGNIDENSLPEFYIPRKVLVDYINTTDLLDRLQPVEKNALIFNCPADFKNTVSTRHASMMELDAFLGQKSLDKFNNLILLSIDVPCTYSKFESVRKKLDGFQVYLFQTVHRDCCIHLMNVGRKQLLKNCKNMYIKEEKIFNYFKSELNVLFAPPGMGKTTLFNVFSKNCPPYLWVVHVKLIDHNPFMATHPDAQFLKHFLRVDEENQSLYMKILRVYLKNKKILILLDGVDELESKNVNRLLNCAKLVVSQGFHVWISCRENCQQRISQNLKFFTIVEIVELSENEQMDYIEKRLRKKYNSSVIKEMVDATFENSEIVNSRQLLGVPLLLYIITENFLTNENLVLTLRKENIFVLTTMYRLFFKGKKKFLLEKLCMDECSEQLGFDFEDRLKHYELPALKVCLDDQAFKKVNLDENQSHEFLKSVKTIGDKFGIIKSVTTENTAVFYHQTYAEYFTCVWFVRNLDKMKLLREEWFSEKYQNLRLMFDIMLCEQSPLHLAVVYNNIEQFRKYVDNPQEDKAGRDALYLACCYGMKYPLPENWDYTNCYLKRESEIYIEIVHALLERCHNIFKEDTIFGINYINYALSCQCLFVIEACLERELLSFRKIDKLLKKYYQFKTLAFYASQMDYIHLLKKLLQRVDLDISFRYSVPDLRIVSLLDVAIIGSRNQHAIVPKKENVASVEKILQHRNKRIIRVQNKGFEIYLRSKHFIDRHLKNGKVLKLCCEFGCYKIMNILLPYQNFCNGDNILHMTAKYGTMNEEVIELSQTIDLDVNQKNQEGKTALYIACENGDEQCVKKLLDSGAEIDVQNEKRKDNIFHVTAKLKKENIAIMHMMLNKMNSEGKSLVNFPDLFGHYPLLLAVESFHINYVKLLLQNGAEINVCDSHGNSALHYAADLMFSEEMDLLKLLIENDANINLQNSKGQTPLHLAVKHERLDKIEKSLDFRLRDQTCWLEQKDEVKLLRERWNKVETLLDSGADINVMDNEGMTVLHYVVSHDEDLKGIASLGKSRFIFELPFNRQKVHVKNLEECCIVNRLYDSGADINVFVSEKMTVISFDEFANSVENVNQLVHNGVSLVVKKVYDGYLRICLAAGKYQQRDTLNKLFDSVADINVMDNENITIWHFDASDYCDEVENVKLLVDNGVNLNAQNISGETALHLVVENRNYNKLKALLQFGADVNIVNCNKENILHHAMRRLLISKEAEYVSKMLINKDVNINAQNVHGESPLHLAFQYHDLSVVKHLLENGAKENLITLERRNMLHYAAESWCHNNITELLEKGFDKNAQDINGTSILHCACRSGRLKNIQILISSGANISVINNEQQTILHYAAMSSYPEEDVMKYLVETGVDLYAKDSNGRNALDVAFEYKCFKALQLLIETDKFFDPAEVPWPTLLFYSAFGGCCHGINYLIKNCENISNLDCRTDFSLEFLKPNGKLQTELLLEITKYVYFLTEVLRNYPTMVYEPRTFIEYCNYEISPNDSKSGICKCIFGYPYFVACNTNTELS